MYGFLKYYIIIILFAAALQLRGEDLIITGVTYNNYPALKVDFYYLNAQGEPVDLSKTDIKLRYNSAEYADFLFNNGSAGEYKRPVIIAIDNSESVNSEALQQIKAAVQQFVVSKSPNEEFALQAFGKFVRRMSGFSKDIPTLTRGLKLGEGYSYSDLSGAFFEDAAGIFPEDAGKKSSVVLITNGLALQGGKFSEIVSRAKSIGIEINVINMGGVYDKRLKDLADSTGGLNFFNVSNELDILKALFAIRAHANSFAPCTIDFYTSDCELNPTIEIIRAGGSASNFRASIPQSEIPGIDFPLGQSIDFGVATVPVEKTIELTARGGDVVIDSVATNNPKFKIINFTPGVLLKKDSTLKLTTRYVPTDTNFEFCLARVYANICDKAEYYCSAGNRESVVKNNLRIVRPNGGEKFLEGSLIDVKWLGVAETDSISLEYSLNGGGNWTQLTPIATGFTKTWLAPNVEARNCLVRVKKLSEKPDMSKILVLSNHKEIITSIAWRSDSKQLATASTDGNIIIWDAETGKEIKRLFQSIKKPIRSIAWSPNDKYIAIASLSNSIKIFNIAGDFQEAELIGGDADISQIRWSPWGVDIFAADKAGRVFRWSNLNSEARYGVQIHSGEIKDFEINPSGNNIATSGVDGKVNLIDFQTGSFIKTIYQGSQPINGIAFSPSGNNLAIANGGTVIHIYEVSSGEKKLSLYDVVQPTLDVDWSPAADYIATISSDKTVKIWDAGTGSLYYAYALHNEQPNLIKFNTGGSKIASAEPGAVVHVWSPLDAPFEKKSIDIDESDSAFSIVPAVLSVDRINTPAVAVGESVVYAQPNAVKNLSEVPLRVDSLKIVNDAQGVFQTLDNLQTTLDPNGSMPAVIKFTPNSPGLFSAKIYAYTEAGIFSADAFGQGIAPSFDSALSIIDFANTLPGKSRDTTLDVLQKKFSAPLEIASIRKLNAAENAFTFDEGYKKTLDANNPKLNMKLKFSPQFYGDYSQTLEISFKGSPIKAYALLRGNSAEERIEAPPTFDFGIAVCEDSVPGRVRLRNTGSKTIEIDSVRVVPADKAFFVIGDYSDLNIEQGQEGVIQMAFITKISGDFTARLEIYANGRADFITSAQLHGRKANPIFGFDQDKIDIIETEPGEIANRSFKIQNEGEVPLMLDYELNSNKFEVKSPANPIRLDVGATANIVVAFRGAQAGYFEALAKFTDSCGNYREIPITATIGQPDPRISEVGPPQEITLSCAGTGEIVYSVRNTGTTLLKIDSVTFAPASQNSFEVISSPATVKPDSIGDIIFQYHTGAPGENSVLAVIHTNAVNVPEGKLETNLKASFLPYFFSADASALDFDKTPSGTRDTLTFAVTNSGSLEFTPKILPPGAGFSILGAANPTILPGVTANVLVEFKPELPEREYIDSAIIESPCGDRLIVYLRGESVKPAPIDTTTTLIDTSGRLTLSYIYSNPNSGDFRIQYFVPKKGRIELDVTDLLGAPVASLESGDFERGLYKREYSVRGVASGIYFLRLTYGSLSLVRKLYIIK